MPASTRRFEAGTCEPWRDGADATRPAIVPAYHHPPAVQRFAPTITRLQRKPAHASKLARPGAADPRGRWVFSKIL